MNTEPMDKYEQFQLEQSSLLKALAESGPTESLQRRMQALYQNACFVVALGPSAALQVNPEEKAPDPAEEDASAFDIQAYIRTIESGELAHIFEMKPWGDVALAYETVELDGRTCPGVRVTWSNRIAFLAEGKSGAFNEKLENMASALADELAATWHRWEVRLV